VEQTGGLVAAKEHLPIERGNGLLPLEKEHVADSLQMVVQKWSLEDADNIREIAKRRQVTVNDVLLSCYAHALCETSNFPEGRPFTVTCMVDNRKYIKPSATIGLTNHVGLLQLKMDRCESTIEKTLHCVHNLTKRGKNKHYFGLSGIPLIGLGYVLPCFYSQTGHKALVYSARFGILAIWA